MWTTKKKLLNTFSGKSFHPSPSFAAVPTSSQLNGLSKENLNLEINNQNLSKIYGITIPDSLF